MTRTYYTWINRKIVLLTALGLLLLLFTGIGSATDLRNIESIQPLAGSQITIHGNLSLNSQDVYVLVAHPPDSTSFVVGAYASREEAEEDRAALSSKTPAEVLSYQVDLSSRGW